MHNILKQITDKKKEKIKIVKREYPELTELIDKYEGGKLQKDKCSLAYRLWYRSKDKTLTDMDVQPIHERIRNALIQSHSAELRS